MGAVLVPKQTNKQQKKQEKKQKFHTLPGHFGHTYSHLVELDWLSIKKD